MLSNLGDVFMGGRPVRVTGITVEHQRTGFQRFFESFPTECDCLVVVVRTNNLEIHPVAHLPPVDQPNRRCACSNGSVNPLMVTRMVRGPSPRRLWADGDARRAAVVLRARGAGAPDDTSGCRVRRRRPRSVAAIAGARMGCAYSACCPTASPHGADPAVAGGGRRIREPNRSSPGCRRAAVLPARPWHGCAGRYFPPLRRRRQRADGDARRGRRRVHDAQGKVSSSEPERPFCALPAALRRRPFRPPPPPSVATTAGARRAMRSAACCSTPIVNSFILCPLLGNI